MISSTAWVSRGLPARNPTKYALDPNEMQRLSKLAGVQFDEAKAQLESARIRLAGDVDVEEEEEEEAEEREWSDEDDEDDEDEGKGARKIKMQEDQQATKTEAEAEADPNDLSRYNLDTYGEDDEDEDGMAGGNGNGNGNSNIFSNIKGLQYHRNNDQDPYITLRGASDLEEEEAAEREELQVLKEDNMIVSCKTEDEISMLEVHIYNHHARDFFVHHDLLLPAFPLALQWLDFNPAGVVGASSGSGSVGAKGNFVAVATMDPTIEIWNLDVVDGLFPNAILGNQEAVKAMDMPAGTGKKKRRMPAPRIPNDAYHVDAVLGLSWNTHARNLLASCSADSTVKLWDLTRAPSGATDFDSPGGTTALRSFSHHTDKVQSVAWDTSGSSIGAVPNPAVLLSGSYDKTLRVFDTRTPEKGLIANVHEDVECLTWDPWNANRFIASFEDGLVKAYDVRSLPSAPSSSPPSNPKSKSSATKQQHVTQALFTLAAHDGACTSVSFSKDVKGCFVTGGTDKLAKVWNATYEEDDAAGAQGRAPNKRPKEIALVASRDLDAGKIFSTSLSPDDPLVLSVGGSAGKLRLWDLSSNAGVRKTFAKSLHELRSARPDMTPDADASASADEEAASVLGLSDGDEESDEDEEAVREPVEEDDAMRE
ncbi:WD40 repeat-like protein [Ceraceosorus guamensis]|uniref:WD40 repeat-like protein n=1 Tax=Ceraceosorus guamensis TaxID=1522189 RepID=A0A316VTN2_9BASI|nr:WD40 repeat-like protein [Ceraceosorus guamensis]PWN39803.1 WD40 repeat-like protein [Ceraceosorus guamensis]